MPSRLTPSQTIGPFFRYGLQWKDGAMLFPATLQARAIRITGVVTEGDGQPVADALLEFWQADPSGNFGAKLEGSCAGFGRVATDDHGRYAIQTLYPGALLGADLKKQAPHIVVVLFARGLLHQLLTRVYFEGDGANPGDAVLASCGARGETLLAKRVAGVDEAYVWNLSLQGTKETVFFDC